MRSNEPGGPSTLLEQVGPPDRLAHADGLGRVHRSLQLAAFELADFETHTPLGPFLTGPLVGVEKVEVAHHHADGLEPERIQHVALPIVTGLAFSLAMSASESPEEETSEIHPGDLYVAPSPLHGMGVFAGRETSQR